MQRHLSGFCGLLLELVAGLGWDSPIVSQECNMKPLAMGLLRTFLVKSKLFQRNAKCQFKSYAVVFNRKARIMTAIMVPLVAIVV